LAPDGATPGSRRSKELSECELSGGLSHLPDIAVQASEEKAALTFRYSLCEIDRLWLFIDNDLEGGSPYLCIVKQERKLNAI
jgi:hypothetical protein